MLEEPAMAVELADAQLMEALDRTTLLLPLSDRMRRFRDASRARADAAPRSPKRRHMSDAFFDPYARRPYWERYARSLAHALEQEPVYLFDDERLVGMTYQTWPGPPEPDEELDLLWAPYSPAVQMRLRQEQEIEPYLRVGGAPGHIGWRWDEVLELGIEGHMADLRERLARAHDDKSKRLYRGAIILWRSVLSWNERHVQALRTRAEVAQGQERKRMEQLIALCSRVPRYPATTFHEAVQSYYLQYLAVMYENPYGGNGPGRLDYFLWPYLQHDLQRGLTTLEQARELLDELFIRFEERLHHADGWVESVVVGGVHPDGTTAVNPLSYLMIQSIAGLNQTHPAVYTRISHDSPEEFVDLNVQYLLHGQNRAQIYNDESCLKAITGAGVAWDDAVHYMAGGCMEISPQGTTCDSNFSCTHNVAKTLELVLNGGIDMRTGERRISLTSTLEDYVDFEPLYAAFEAELVREYREMTRALDIASECYARYRPCYLLSSLTLDCLERGHEQQDGGARYHDYGFAPLAITTAADSLSAICRAVYQLRWVSAAEMLAALRADFVGHEPLRSQLGSLPRFGVEDSLSDSMCDRVLQSVGAAAAQQRTRYGGRLKPMIFNFVWTPSASRELAARGDGSPAGTMIGHGMTPHSRAMTRGITAAMNSSLSLDYGSICGGATTMWDVDEQWVNVDLMKALLKAFLAGGGMIFQGNTTSVAQLEDAYAHPERYPNLIVRVGGFSARFATLGRDVQQEIIVRRRHQR
jgi:pyruvate-formate lyase